LCVCEKWQAGQQEDDELGEAPSPHTLLSHSLGPVPSRLWVTGCRAKKKESGTFVPLSYARYEVRLLVLTFRAARRDVREPGTRRD
jgi:hypothetical protein